MKGWVKIMTGLVVLFGLFKLIEWRLWVGATEEAKLNDHWVRKREQEKAGAARMVPVLDVPVGFLRHDVELDVTPAGYLKRMVIDPDVSLSVEERRKLGVLFKAAAKATRERYDQDMAIGTRMPVYQVLRRCFPEVRKNEREHGAMVFLGDVEKSLEESVPD